MNAQRVARLVIASGLMLLPAVAWAQTVVSGTIAGLVTDATGAVLPGVTVEAASPALIERVRTSFTDDLASQPMNVRKRAVSRMPA